MDDCLRRTIPLRLTRHAVTVHQKGDKRQDGGQEQDDDECDYRPALRHVR